jgi:hypothetical protein
LSSLNRSGVDLLLALFSSCLSLIIDSWTGGFSAKDLREA